MKPMPLPRRRGRRIEDAGCAKTCEGRVMEGMKVVIFTADECQRCICLWICSGLMIVQSTWLKIDVLKDEGHPSGHP